MKGTIILAATALTIMLGLLVFVHKGAESSQPTEPSSPVSVASSGNRSVFAPRQKDFVASPESASDRPAGTNLWTRSEFEVPYLTREQVEPFLEKNRRSVESLLGALRASGDPELLKEAKEKFPDDPRVQFAAAFKSDTPEERRQWLEKFKESAADNALPNYLLATEHFKAGETDLALKEIAAANGKSTFENYLLDFVQNTEEAYRAGGYSEASAKAAAGEGALLPELAQLKAAGVELVDLAKKYQQAGDQDSAQAALKMASNLGHRLDGTPQTTLVQELVGMAIERKVLDAMNPGASYGDTGKTVQDQINALTQRRKDIRELTTAFAAVFPTLSEPEAAHYFDRIKMYGDFAAAKWVLNRTPQQ
jgi:hypothetical protein